MKFWQRALKSVTRRKGRSFILFLVIFILGNVIAGSVAIQQSTQNVEKETKRQMGARATVDMDYEKWEKYANENQDLTDEEYMELLKPPTLEEYESLGELPYVKYFDYSVNAWIGTNNIKSYSPDGSGMMYDGGVKHRFNGKGVNRSQMLDIEEGLIKLETGELFSEQDIQDGNNVAIISKEVAELNNVTVGDTLVIDASEENYIFEEDGESEGNDDSVLTFDFPVKIVGTFSVIRKADEQPSNPEEGMSEADWMATEQINTIYAPNKTMQAFNREQNEKLYQYTEEELEQIDANNYYNTIFVLNTVDDVEPFREEANVLLSNEFYAVRASVDEYEQVAGGMKKLGTISSYVVIIAVLATILIISLVVLLFLRDRKHELGIYLSLGESRTEIIGQIVVELVLTSAVALILSLVTGNLLGSAVSDSLLQTDWLNGNQDIYYSYGDMMNSGVSYEDIQAAYKVTFSTGYIISYLLLGLGTVLLSAILPLLYILRLNPKKIMM